MVNIKFFSDVTMDFESIFLQEQEILIIMISSTF